MVINILLNVGALANTNDPIDTLASRLSHLSQNHLWMNGPYPIIDLPADSAPIDVIKKCTEMWGFQDGHIKKYKVLEIKEVEIYSNGKFKGAVLDSDHGKKLLLFRFEYKSWWSRFFDIE